MKETFCNLHLIDVAALDQIKLLHLKKYLLLYPVDIEADKICQTKKKKDMLASENRKQLLTDAFEHWCS